jgi:quinol monooxygenase YgiN
MAGVTVLAVYRPKPGQAGTLDRLVAEHLPVLRAEGLVTDYPATVLKSADGTVVELFEWVSQAAIDQAHGNQAVLALWERFGAACDYLPIADLPEAKQLFSPFTRVGAPIEP